MINVRANLRRLPVTLVVLLAAAAAAPVLADTRPASAPTSAPATDTFTNPIVRADAPDPWVVFKDGWYYFTATLDADGGVSVWKSRTLTGLDRGRKAKVWAAPKSGPMSKMIWAPELHFLRGKWYLYFTASDGVDKNHRHYVLEAKTDDPLGEYVDRGRVDPELDAYAIDGSVLEMPDGKLYWMYTTGSLEIAPMTSPTRVDGSRRVRLATATYPWERHWVEAPEALIHDGRVFVVYSAGHSGTPHYSLGMLTLTGSDVLDPKNWEKSPVPVFYPYFGPDGAVYNVGHNGFTKSPDGKEDWIVYHGKDWRDNDSNGFHGRKTRLQRFTWNADGTPAFGHPIPSGVRLKRPSGEPAPE
jgi:GH43 family beta-xylosidase